MMRKLAWSMGLTALLGVAGTGAEAGTIQLNNTTEVAYYNAGNPYSVGGNYWGAPAIGAPTYYTPSGSIGWTDLGGGQAQLTIQFSTGLYTGQDNSYSGSPYNVTVYGADIFIKSGGANSLPVPNSSFYDYAIALCFDGADGGYSSPGLYKLPVNTGANPNAQSNSYRTSNQVWTGGPSTRSDFYYGGAYAPAADFTGANPPCKVNVASCGDAEQSPTVLLADGGSTEVGGVTTEVQSIAPLSGTLGTLDVTLIGDAGILAGIFDDFDIFWGTGDCSNAPIWGNVADVVPASEPSTLAVLLSALAFAAWFKRRGQRALAGA
jgi:hypothetical protein